MKGLRPAGARSRAPLYLSMPEAGTTNDGDLFFFCFNYSTRCTFFLSLMLSVTKMILTLETFFSEKIYIYYEAVSVKKYPINAKGWNKN